MATSDYHPYPMHTAQDSAPLRSRHQSVPALSIPEGACKGPTSSKRFRATEVQPTKPAQRVDSGLDDAASETSSCTFTEEVDRVAAVKLCLHQYHDFGCESMDTDDDDDEDIENEGNLGRMAKDSVYHGVERASGSESKEARAKRNMKRKLKMVKKWLKRLLASGSNARSYSSTDSI